MPKKPMEDLNQFETIKCPLCSCDEYETVYQCFQETGYTLGRIQTSFVVCNDCGFMYQNPRPKVELLIKHYAENIEASGSVYHDQNPDASHDKRQKARQVFYERFFNERNEGSLLEVGCSTGEFLLTLRLNNWRLTGLEASENAANQARANGVSVICGFLEEIKLPEESFDAVCCFGVLEHLHDINNTLQIMTRILKQGGYLCVEVPDSMKPAPQVSEFFSFEHLSHFTKDTLILFLKGYGYSHFIFDDAVSDARLRMCAWKTGKAMPLNESGIGAIDKSAVYDARKELIARVKEYKAGKDAFEKDIRGRLSSHILRWKSQGKKVAIYGAGVHTRYLMNLFDMSENISAILDSDPRKHGKKFLRWTVSDESLLEGGQVDAVIISSKPFENEIYKRIEKYATGTGLEIVRCYA